jgi:hypothetical protein
MTPTKPKRKIDELELLPPDVAKRRTDDLLRRMLNSPPEPFTPKPKKKRKKK